MFMSKSNKTKSNETKLERSIRFGLSFLGVKSMTKQSFKDECSIDRILARHGLQTLLAANARSSVDEYGYVDDVNDDISSSLKQLSVINAKFEYLPDDLRHRFGNVSNMLDFISKEYNQAEAVRLGLIKPATDDKTALEPVLETGSGDKGADATASVGSSSV